MLKRFLSSAVVMLLLITISAPNVLAADQTELYAQIPTFNIQINNQIIDNVYATNPLLVYNDVTYVPMTWVYANALGLETQWSAEAGLSITKRDTIDLALTVFIQDGNGNNTLGESKAVQMCPFPVTINGRTIDNTTEEYPILTYANITYFPMTWHYMSEEMGLQTSWSNETGYIVNVPEVDPSQLMYTVYHQDYSNGYYEGHMLNGSREGIGTYTWSDGGEYYGEWLNGERTGYGYYTWDNGDAFEGEFIDGIKQDGIIIKADGSSFEYNYEAAQAKAEDQAQVAFRSLAYSGPSYEELLKNESSFIGDVTYFSGEVIMISENNDGTTYMIIDTSSFSNDFLDMYNTYGDSSYYMDNVESEYVGIYSPVHVDILQGDSIDAYGYVIYDLSFYDAYSNTYYYPSIELNQFDRTSYRSEELIDMMFGN